MDNYAINLDNFAVTSCVCVCGSDTLLSVWVSGKTQEVDEEKKRQ